MVSWSVNAIVRNPAAITSSANSAGVEPPSEAVVCICKSQAAEILHASIQLLSFALIRLSPDFVMSHCFIKLHLSRSSRGERIGHLKISGTEINYLLLPYELR